MINVSVFDRVRGLSEQLYSVARTKMLDDGELIPVQFIIKDKGVIAIPSPWENYSEKRKMSRFATLLAGLVDADAIVFYSEAWVLETKIEKSHEDEYKKFEDEMENLYKKHGSLDGHPDRKEKLLLTIFFADGLVLVGCGDIERAGHEQRAFAGELNWLDGGEDPKSHSASSTLYVSWRANDFRKTMDGIIEKMPSRIRASLDSLKESMRLEGHVFDDDTNFALQFAKAFMDQAP